MKKYLRMLTVLSLVALLSLTLTGVASADVIRGIGWLYAKGSGVATLHMTGRIQIEGHGVGLVYIRGAEHIEAQGHGQRADLPGGGVLFRGYQGTIKATGRQMTIRMEGSQIEFTAHGKGVAHLRGRGHYETRNQSGDWAPNGLTIEVVEE